MTKKYNPMSKEFQEEVKRLGLTGNQLVEKYRKEAKVKFNLNTLEQQFGKEFANWAKENIGKVPDKWIDAGCKTRKEYVDRNAQKLLFKDESERIKNWRHDKKINLPMKDNKECSSYLGVHKGEILFGKKFLPIIFEHVEHTNYGNRGFDFICKDPKQEFIDKYPHYKLERCKEYKVQIKTRSLTYVSQCDTYSGYMFNIRYNNIPDIFILVGFEEREDPCPSVVWMFLKNYDARAKKFWNRDTFSITNNQKGFRDFVKFQLKDELNRYIGNSRHQE